LTTRPSSSWWQIAFDVINQGRGIAKQVSIAFLSQPGMVAQFPGYDWHPLRGIRDATTGQMSLAFELGSTRVIHPGMAVRFAELGLRSPDVVPGDFVQLAGTLYCEGCAPVHMTISGRLAADSG
jgi:hypothetical protein